MMKCIHGVFLYTPSSILTLQTGWSPSAARKSCPSMSALCDVRELIVGCVNLSVMLLKRGREEDPHEGTKASGVGLPGRRPARLPGGRADRGHPTAARSASGGTGPRKGSVKPSSPVYDPFRRRGCTGSHVANTGALRPLVPIDAIIVIRLTYRQVLSWKH